MLELGFASLKGNMTQTRRAIASVAFHSKGSIWDQFVFHMEKYHIFVHTLCLSYWFKQYLFEFNTGIYYIDIQTIHIEDLNESLRLI